MAAATSKGGARMTNNSKRLRLTYGAVTLGLMAAIGLACVPTSRAHAQISGARDCSPNSIDNKPLNGGCGALTPKEFIKDLHDNDPSDLQAIYAAPIIGSLTQGKYERFANNARMGTLYRNGNLVVDGKTVITDAATIGRKNTSGNRTPITLGNKQYFYSKTRDSFADGVQSIPAMVLFNDEGVVEIAVLTACGNPIIGMKSMPVYYCHSLRSTPVAGEKDTYDFTANIVATHNAVVSKVVYDFGDGTPLVTQSSGTTPTRHAYQQPGVFTAKVTVHYRIPGNLSKVESPTRCTTTITVAKAKQAVPVAAVVERPPVLPKAGMGGFVGVGAIASIAGVTVHRLYMRRKR